MCNRYASDIRKAGLGKEFYGLEEWSETRITPMLGNAVLEVFPKSFGPVLKPGEDGRLHWEKMRWGLPGPPQFGGAPVTNIRKVKSPHWRPLLGPAHRRLVPFTAFSEYEDALPKGAKVIRWFAPAERGICTSPASGASGPAIMVPRKSPAKAMPLILRDSAAQQEWLSADASELERIPARVLPESLEIV